MALCDENTNKKRIIINVNPEKSRVFAPARVARRPMLMLSTKWTMLYVYVFHRFNAARSARVLVLRLCVRACAAAATSNTANLYASDSTLYFST